VDALKTRPNAMVLTTSNITEAIDLAFVDRADIKAYIGPPGLEARYEILRSAVIELCERDLVQAEGGLFPAAFRGLWRDGIEATAAAATAAATAGAGAGVEAGGAAGAGGAGGAGGGGRFGSGVGAPSAATAALAKAAAACEGLSGRALRKLPFLAYATAQTHAQCPLLTFLQALAGAAHIEFKDREHLHSG